MEELMQSDREKKWKVEIARLVFFFFFKQNFHHLILSAYINFFQILQNLRNKIAFSLFS